MCQGRERKGRKGKGGEGRGRVGKGRERKGREGKGRKVTTNHIIDTKLTKDNFDAVLRMLSAEYVLMRC